MGNARRWWRTGVHGQSFGNGYRNLLSNALRHPGVALGVTGAVPVMGFLAASTLGM